jgi:hypothetical protein
MFQPDPGAITNQAWQEVASHRRGADSRPNARKAYVCKTAAEESYACTQNIADPERRLAHNLQTLDAPGDE